MLTPNGDGYFIAATKDSLTILNGATQLGSFPSTCAIIQDGDSIVISGAGITKKYPITGFDSIYAVSGANSPALILKSANWLISMLETKYDITITGGENVRLNKAELDIISSDDEILYFGEIITTDANGSVILATKAIGASNVNTFANNTGPGLGLPNQSYCPNVVFNHCEVATTGDAGNIYFFGYKFTYTVNP